MERCAECGAPGSECAARFDECLVKEFEDPRYGRVHNLTVAAYMLQHSSKFSRAGWLYERDLLREFIVDGVPPERIRSERKDALDSGKHEFSFKSPDGKPLFPQVPWSKTILGVRLDDPQFYCEDIIAWAAATLADSEAIDV